jgi:hypothetical protein
VFSIADVPNEQQGTQERDNERMEVLEPREGHRSASRTSNTSKTAKGLDTHPEGPSTSQHPFSDPACATARSWAKLGWDKTTKGLNNAWDLWKTNIAKIKEHAEGLTSAVTILSYVGGAMLAAKSGLDLLAGNKNDKNEETGVTIFLNLLNTEALGVESGAGKSGVPSLGGLSSQGASSAGVSDAIEQWLRKGSHLTLR